MKLFKNYRHGKGEIEREKQQQANKLEGATDNLHGDNCTETAEGLEHRLDSIVADPNSSPKPSVAQEKDKIKNQQTELMMAHWKNFLSLMSMGCSQALT
ncbi:hypothetical protein DsansV1_C16g0141961 [Dioscorea sansibarensis]